MYMLNLIFDPTQTDGRFVNYNQQSPNSDPLQNSKVWLQLQGGGVADLDPQALNPQSLTSPYSWSLFGPDGSLHVSKSQAPSSNPNATVPPFFAVRVGLIAGGSLPGGTAYTLTVIFGRQPRATQPFPSPFTQDDTSTGRSCNVFSQSGSILSGTGQPQIYFPLKPIANAPGSSGITHNYEFEVGLVLGSPTLTFAHDPELDVSM